jgi:colanic acid biosynthesis glycosyl transferase WcaI
LPQSIVFVNRYYDPDQSATSQMLTDLARGLAARGCNVHVVTSRQLYDDPARSLAPQEQLHGVHVHRVATTRFGRHSLLGRTLDYASFYIACAALLLRLPRRGDLLVAKTDPPLFSIPAAAIARIRGLVLINWLQDLFPEVATQLGANPLPAWLNRSVIRMRDASLRAASMNVCIGSRMRDLLAARGIPDIRLCIIENWADAHAIKPKPGSTSGLRARLQLSDRFVVCYSGNLGRAHEFDTLLSAAQALELESDFAFLVIGGGAKVEALRRAVQCRGLESFCFLPYQSRESLDDSLAAADLHWVSLQPGLEGLVVPSKVYGIMAAGRGVIFIGDADGEVARVIRRGQCGVAVPPGDSALLVSRLRELKGDPQTVARMGTAARQMLCSEYSLQGALERWLTLIDGISAIDDERRRADSKALQ